MADRTYVNVYVLDAHADKAQAILRDSNGHAMSTSSGNGLTHFGYAEVNYADLGCEQELQAAGIPYIKGWEAGNDYVAGTEYCRYTAEGELVVMGIDDNEHNPPLDKLMELLDNPEQLVEFIRAFHDKVIPLPWNDQEEFSKRFQARQLVAPSNT